MDRNRSGAAFTVTTEGNSTQMDLAVQVTHMRLLQACRALEALMAKRPEHRETIHLAVESIRLADDAIQGLLRSS